ncbi:MAG: NAD-dependent epimerase/dehydratase family protein [Lachnospiraceae bacterium]|nr:NAD-dependent epimerase/dehydratase family protein [Lachnospiraceae bacterium]
MKIYENEFYKEDLHKVAKLLPQKEFSILITGATGLIGSFIVDTLLYANEFLGTNYTIYAMGRSKERLESRFPYAKNNSKLYFIEQDICESINEEIDVDYIINGASNADPKSYSLYPVETILTNVLGTKNILEFANKKKCKQVLFTSTMEVYGEDIKSESYTETDYGKINFNMVRSGYPESKRVAELLCKSYLLEYNVPSVIARLGYIYGPTMTKTDNKVVAQFIRSSIKKENIILKSEGKQVRSYLYVADTVSAIFSILFFGKSGETYNVSSSQSITSIRSMAEWFVKYRNTKLILEISNQTNTFVQNNILDENKLRELNWEPFYNLEQGLQRTIQILESMESYKEIE